MTEADTRRTTAEHRKRSINRELAELAALFFATGIADLFVSTLSNNRIGPTVLFALGGLLVVSAGARHWWTHRPSPRTARPQPETATEWRLRTTVRDVPGSLAALTATLAAHRYDIVSMQVLGVSHGAVDEFLLRAPDRTTADAIAQAARSGGGENVQVAAADIHEFVDQPTRILAIAGQATDPEADLPHLLGALLGQSCAAEREPGRRTPDERMAGTTMRLHGSAGELIELRRPVLPFTPAEFARAKALIGLHRQALARASD